MICLLLGFVKIKLKDCFLCFKIMKHLELEFCLAVHEIVWVKVYIETHGV